MYLQHFLGSFRCDGVLYLDVDDLYPPNPNNVNEARQNLAEVELNRHQFHQYDIRIVRHKYITVWKLMFSYSTNNYFMEKSFTNDFKDLVNGIIPPTWHIVRIYMEVPQHRRRWVVAEIDVSQIPRKTV